MTLIARLKAYLTNTVYTTHQHYKTLNVSIHPIFLTFNNTAYESAFNDHYSQWITTRVRIGSLFVVVAVIFDVVAGLLNQDQTTMAWVFRGGMILLCVVAFFISYTAFFRTHYPLFLSTLIIFIGLAQSFVVVSDSTPNALAYFGMIFTAPLACCILGLKFITSIVTISCMLLNFSLLIAFDETRSDQLLAYNTVFFVYLVLACSINYLLEHSMRREFLYQQLLEFDRKKYAQLAQHDSLTQLTNRYGLINQLTKKINFNAPSPSPSPSRPIGLFIFIDLNDFKKINDQYGHIAGDEVLKVIAQRLSDASYNDHNITARLGGDEFVIFLDAISSIKDIDYWLEHLSTVIAQPIKLQPLDTSLAPHHVSISASFGYSIIRGNEVSIEHILEQADQRMYENKREAKGY